MKFTTILSTCFALFAVSGASGAEIAVFPVEVTNLTQSQGDAIGTVMAQQYARLAGKSVLTPAKTVGAVVADSGNLTAAAQRLGVKQFVAMNAVALTSKIMLEAVLYDISGKELFRSQMTAASLDDISDVCDRLAAALIQRVSTEVTMTLDNITEQEGRDKNRVGIEKIKGIKIQYFSPFERPGFQIDPMASIGFDMRVEGNTFFLEFAVAPFFPSSGLGSSNTNRYGGAYIELGGDYYLINNRIASPYIGGGVSPRFTIVSSSNYSSDMMLGIAPYFQAGVMFLRYSKMRMYVDFRIAKNVMPYTFNQGGGEYVPGYNDANNNYVSSSYTPSTTVKTLPWEIGMAIGMGW